jgi:sec-independent protein translocase protein TatA
MGRLFDSPVHLLILLLVIVVLFGAKRLPDAARGLGRSLRILKSEVKEMQDEGKPRSDTSAAAARPEPLEGRVVQPTDSTTSDQRHDA